jgi:predicted transposase/invertase (TIGR01784 family)
MHQKKEDSTDKKNAQNPLHQIDDKLFKLTFQNRPALLAFLTRYAPPHLIEHMDLDRLELDNTEYVNKDLRKFQSDIVWNTTFKGKPAKIILLFEHKKDLDKAVYVQILLYLCLIWLLEVQNGQQMSCILPIVVHQSSGGAIWDSRDFHHFFEHVPSVFLEFIPNFRFFLMHVQKVPNAELLQIPEENLLRALLLAYKCVEEPESIQPLFAEIFKFYESQPELREVVHQYLLYLMTTLKLTSEQILKLIETISPKTKEATMTAYEEVVLKNQTQGKQSGDKLRILKTIWIGKHHHVATEILADCLSITPLVVKKWLTWMPMMLQEDQNGLPPNVIAAKINEFGAEPQLTPDEVNDLLVFLKTPLPAPMRKTRTRKPKS